MSSNETLLNRALNLIEKKGNKLPDPVTLFIILSALVLMFSWIGSRFGISAIHPLTGDIVFIENLLDRQGLTDILTKAVSNFQSFPPLGLVLAVMLGAGVAEKSGLMETLMKDSVSKVSPKYITMAVIFAGIMANAAGDAGFIVLPPLAAILFISIGRHPLVGIFAAYAGVSGGFAANLIVNMGDILLASFTIPAAQMIDPTFQSSPAMNLYFMIASTVLLLIVGVFITEKIVEPRFSKYESSEVVTNQNITVQEKKGIRIAGISAAIFLGGVFLLTLGENALLKDPATGSLLAWEAPLMQGLVPLITLLFLIPGLAYGIVTKSIKSDKDAVVMMGNSMKDMGPYIVLAFAASQFLAYFSWSNIGIIISIRGAEALQNAGFTGVGLIVGFVFLSSFINIFLGSASAKWAIMAPVFVPMFLLVGYDPALTQIAYRIGDSVTNTISPLFPYFPILLAFVNKYDKKAGMGTVISNMLPYSISFLIVWILLLFIFVLLNIPVGPNAGIFI
ncbi:aminobenzoyl-glutamate transport protein [Tindallia magadiensis]|uniref:Aminobenzoyl-glutamate transport protein n=1 Tax=Tindallia magadiensis TaxID=69895 RepID=A0A1I3FHX7_9FIRM|nr:AbgT family transporter [Tindallia magadiensis]SFI10848.1 aminobenzoyl-glutamate transport protein [Tindallia magadiensis]